MVFGFFPHLGEMTLIGLLFKFQGKAKSLFHNEKVQKTRAKPHNNVNSQSLCVRYKSKHRTLMTHLNLLAIPFKRQESTEWGSNLLKITQPVSRRVWIQTQKVWLESEILMTTLNHPLARECEKTPLHRGRKDITGVTPGVGGLDCQATVKGASTGNWQTGPHNGGMAGSKERLPRGPFQPTRHTAPQKPRSVPAFGQPITCKAPAGHAAQ